MLTLTFAELKIAGDFPEAYKKFAKFKGGVRKWGKNTPFPLLEVLENNGIENALYALQYSQPSNERDRIARLFACDCAETALRIFERKYHGNKRPREIVETARRFAAGEETSQELVAAREIVIRELIIEFRGEKPDWKDIRVNTWHIARNVSEAVSYNAAINTARDVALNAISPELAWNAQAKLLKKYLEEKNDE